MENRKMNLDRPKISSEEIQAKQDFNQVLNELKLLKKPFYKTTWFWGVTGLASVGLVLALSVLNNNNNQLADDNKNTLENQPTASQPLSDLPEDTDCLHPVTSDAAKMFEVHNVNPKKDTVLYLKDGSIIEVPANALQANTEGNVLVKTRTFHDKTSAFLAGVPMDHKDGAFESAGMIEIRAEQNEKEVSINQKKPLNVTLAMHKPKEGFNFYYLNEDVSKWEDSECVYKNDKINLSTSKAEEKLALQKDIHKIGKEKVTIEEELTSIKLPTKVAYKLPLDKDRIFDLDYVKTDFPELSKLEKVQFEALPNQRNFKTVLETTWSSLDLKTDGKDQYTLQFKSRKDKQTLKVRPVLAGNEKETAQTLFDKVSNDILKRKEYLKNRKVDLTAQEKAKKAALDELVAQFEKDLKNRNETVSQSVPNRVSSESVVASGSASFRANRNGFYNCDKPLNYPPPAMEGIAYVNNQSRFLPKSVYVFDKKKDVRYTYGFGNKGIDDVGFGKGDQVLIAIDKYGKVGYSKVNRKNIGTTFATINLTIIDKKDLNAEFISDILDETPSGVELAQL